MTGMKRASPFSYLDRVSQPLTAEIERCGMPNDLTNSKWYQTSIDATENVSFHWPKGNSKRLSRRHDPTASEASFAKMLSALL